MIDVLEALSDDDLSADSSIVLTYELQLPLYDGWIRRRLSAAGANIQLVFCDLGCYERELAALSTARHCGHSYAVSPVQQRGAFHPKVYLLLGRQRGRIVVGSGNATVGGLVRNAELFGQFDYDAKSDSGPHPAFAQMVGLVRTLGESASGVVGRQLERAIALAPWLELPQVTDGRSVLIAGPGRRPMLQQIDELMGDRKAKSVTVVSSSFDRRLKGLRQLASRAESDPIRCIVQPELARLDGGEVRDLGSSVRWTRFVDPYPKEKKKRRDVRAHAKLLILDCEDEELVIFGSANASRPALVDAENSEVAVAIWRPSGSTIEELGLSESLDSEDVYEILAACEWDTDEDAEPESTAVVLLGAVDEPGRLLLTLGSEQPPPGSLLEVSEGVNRPALLKLPVEAEEDGVVARVDSLVEGSKVVRLVDSAGQPLSNYVAITWRDFGEKRGSSGLGRRAQAAIGAMQDGVVLGTVLFELLSGIRGFDVVLARAGTRRRADDEEAGDDAGDDATEERSESSYYTSERPLTPEGALTGDRADLDLLASLVQPVGGMGGSSKEAGAADDDEDADDALLDEESERRSIDAKGGRASGDERKGASTLASQDSLKRASKRLARRLDAAAAAAEQLLAQLGEIEALPSQTLARQVWMAHIGAFLSGRRTVSVEGKEVLCLEPLAFASYVIRLCRALAGGKDGGLLAKLPEAAWEGPDGETLRRGLAFLWSCAVWSTAHLEQCGPKVRLGLNETLAPLIVARFVSVIRTHVSGMDDEGLTRRLPCVGDLRPGAFEESGAGLVALAELVEGWDRDSAEGDGDEAAVAAGSLVFHPALGLAPVYAAQGSNCHLIDLSRAPNTMVRKFKKFVRVVEWDGWNRQAVEPRLAQIRSSK